MSRKVGPMVTLVGLVASLLSICSAQDGLNDTDTAQYGLNDTDTENNAAHYISTLGWARWDSAIIYRVVDDSYTFSGLPSMEPIDKINFKMFWVNFRSNIEDGGGPKSVSSEFMKFKNVIRRKVRKSSSKNWNNFLYLIR